MTDVIMLGPDGINSWKAGWSWKQQLPLVILWKAGRRRSCAGGGSMFHLVHCVCCAVEAILCSCKVAGGTSPGKGKPNIFQRSTSTAEWKKTKKQNTKQRHLRPLLFARSAVTYSNVTMKLVCLFVFFTQPVFSLVAKGNKTTPSPETSALQAC